MTVAELCLLLGKCDPSDIVVLEGCDCVGLAVSVEPDEKLKAIMIRREEGCGYPVDDDDNRLALEPR